MSIINKEWRSIDGFLNYQVSNIGRVRNAITGKILKPWGVKNYLQIKLSKDSKPYTISVHKLVANEFIQNPDNKPQVDHIDGNAQNNIFTNLRWATNSQNLMNRTYKCAKQTSIYKGVSLYKRTKKWRATLTFNKQRIHLGFFNDEVEAAKAYDEKVKELCDDYAILNFPLEN